MLPEGGLRGWTAERPEGDLHHLIRTMPAKEAHLAGVVLCAYARRLRRHLFRGPRLRVAAFVCAHPSLTVAAPGPLAGRHQAVRQPTRADTSSPFAVSLVFPPP